MSLYDYQRTVIAYHGCDASVAEEVFGGRKGLEFSKNDHDWLGHGIYFWEHGPNRAMDWAKERTQSSPTTRVKTPAVVGAFINLGKCFDLLDTRYTKSLAKAYTAFKKTIRPDGLEFPKNKSPRNQSSPDEVVRLLDCAVINWTLDSLKTTIREDFQTVRCVFTEGEPAFPGSKIMLKSHIQVAVRDPACILGYFRPNLDIPGDLSFPIPEK